MPAADVRKADRLQVSLQRAVFAAAAVNQWKGDVGTLRLQPGLERKSIIAVIAALPAVENAFAPRRRNEAAVARHAQRNDFQPLLRCRIRHRSR